MVAEFTPLSRGELGNHSAPGAGCVPLGRARGVDNPMKLSTMDTSELENGTLFALRLRDPAGWVPVLRESALA